MEADAESSEPESSGGITDAVSSAKPKEHTDTKSGKDDERKRNDECGAFFKGGVQDRWNEGM